MNSNRQRYILLNCFLVKGLQQHAKKPRIVINNPLEIKSTPICAHLFSTGK